MVRTKLLLIATILTCAGFAQAQVNRYMVFFSDKANSTYSPTNPAAFLSQRAIDRRIKNDVPVTEQDFPVNGQYLQGVKQTGAVVQYQSRWVNGVMVQCDASVLPAIEALPYVIKVELIAPGPVVVGRVNKSYLSARPRSITSLKTTTQLTMLGLDSMHNLDIKGEGVKVAVFDSGFPGVNTIAGFSHMQAAILDSYNFVNKQSNVFVNDDHGTEVLSVMAGFIEGTFVGGAYKADYHLYITEEVPTEYRIEEYNWLLAAERADSIGVDVINASLGYNTFDNTSMNYTKAQLDGQTAVVTRAAQIAAEKGIVVVVSAGNEGNVSWKTITPPADARDVLAVGAVTSTGTRSPFSSTGPTSDKRIKPDLCAMGSGTFVIREGGSTGTTSGTSLSSPLLASLVTGIIQRYDTLSRSEIISLLKSTASQAESPDSLKGYGIPNFIAAREKMEFVTGVETPGEKTRFDVFPNPADSGFVYIEAHDFKRDSRWNIELVNPQGAVVKQVSFSPAFYSDRATLDLTQFPSGIFVVRITSGNHTDIFKIVNVR